MTTQKHEPKQTPIKMAQLHKKLLSQPILFAIKYSVPELETKE